MDQLSRHYSRRSHSVAGHGENLCKLRVLDLDINIDRGGAFNLFIKRFQSVSLLEEYLRSSPYVMDQLKEAKIDELDLHRAIVALSEKMKAVDDNASKKKMNRHCIPPGR